METLEVLGVRVVVRNPHNQFHMSRRCIRILHHRRHNLSRMHTCRYPCIPMGAREEKGVLREAAVVVLGEVVRWVGLIREEYNHPRPKNIVGS